MIRNRKKTLLGVMTMAVVSITLTGCAYLNHWGDKVNQGLNGVEATYKTYAQDGTKIDEIKGKSFRITRDQRFDTVDGEGYSNNDSQVLQISLGESTIWHVGSTMILEEAGLEDIQSQFNTELFIENMDNGTPFLNKMRENYQNLWEGKSKTILIRSQDGLPVATYTGNSVEVFPTDVPKSTWFQVDNKMLFVYRADYTIIDNDLLDRDAEDVIEAEPNAETEDENKPDEGETNV